tara:strand:+ start:1042 stop:1188 length:147 start_codon:yes stop_codon:yes gene_type:complete
MGITVTKKEKKKKAAGGRGVSNVDKKAKVGSVKSKMYAKGGGVRAAKF